MPGNSTFQTVMSGGTGRDVFEAFLVPEDMELVGQVARGDPAAFGRLVELHGPYLYGIGFSLSGNRADAEDLVQETFAAVLKGKFRGESSLRTWLVGILVKQAAMMRRTKKRRPALALAETVDPVARTGDGLIGAEARMDLAVMLGELSLEHREIIVLRELEGMSYEKISQTLGIPPGTVESRLHRAREEMRRRFKGYL